jgi:hypothetical protein
MKEGLFYLFFFNETINCERYIQVILVQFFPELTEEENSATAHTACMSMKALFNIFGDNYQQGYLASLFTHINPCEFSSGIV